KHFRKAGAWQSAVRHLTDAEAFDQAAEIIGEHGDAWIASGKLGALSSLAEALPAPALEANPRVLSYRAEVARLRGDFETAQNLFRRAINGLRSRADNIGEAEALHSLGAIAGRRGDFDSAFEYLDRASELSPPNSVVRTKLASMRGMCYVTKGAWA